VSSTDYSQDTAPRFHRLRSISVVGGFLDGMECEFADGLNCFIGARGTGKTTALEFVRYAIDALPDGENDPIARRRIESLITQNLAGGRIQLTIETKDGLSYVVSRTAAEAPIVLTPDGDPTDITFRSGSVFGADIYSQNEVESIADDPVSQLELLDNFESERISSVGTQLRHVRAELTTNANQILPLQEQIAGLKEELGTLSGVEDRLKALSAAGSEDAEAINKAHEEKALRDREKRAVRDLDEFLLEYGLSLEEMKGQVEQHGALSFSEEVLHGPNGESFRYLQGKLRECAGDVDRLLGQAEDRLDEVKGLLSEWGHELVRIHDKQEIAFRELIEKHEVAQGQAAERTALEKRRNDLLAKKRTIDELSQRLERLESDRARLLAHLSELWDERFQIRQEVAEHINAALSPAIRVRVEQFGNPDQYQGLLEDTLRGASMHRNVVAQKLAANLAPQELSAAVAHKDMRKLIDQASLNESQAEKVIAVLASSRALFELESVEMMDKPCIELKDGDSYKDSLSLSTGQKCTTILPILLMDSENPLLIDQPEDNLDNSFIYEAVVKSILDVKTRRQLIFVTHNPNIPVLGDAERVFVLESDGRSARTSNEGTVDECKPEIVTLLEGGEEAFKERKRRYDY